MIDRILKLKEQKNALIIAHYYQAPEIQDLADYVGDSLGMAMYAKEQDNPIAVVCGVRFMAETLKVMNPNKKILLPDLEAGCSLADSCTPEIFSHFLSKHPGAFVMTYVNSSLEVKALSDVICTSANAIHLAKQVPLDREIIFGPDQHLGRHIMKKLGRPMTLFPGNCFVHASFSLKELLSLKAKHPDAEVLAHPECEEALLAQANFVGSTGQLLQRAGQSPAKTFIVLTEPGILHPMRTQNPDKVFIAGPDIEGCSCNECPHMRLNTLEKLALCLENETPEIQVDVTLAAKARKPIDKMVEMTLKGS